MGEVSEKTWEQLKENNDINVRNSILAEYLCLVYKIAGSMSKDYKNHVDYEELASHGTMGLIDAVKRFDVRRGIQFKTYAAIRIRGAIIDYIRKIDWVPRNVRNRYEDIECFCTDWAARYGKTPSDEQIAQGLGLAVRDIVNAKSKWRQHNIISIEWAQSNGAYHIKEKDDWVLPENALLKKEMLGALDRAMAALPPRERQIVMLSFFEGLTLKTIGNVLDVSESRVSQLRSKAIKHLRKSMEE
ncbi:MAG: FliA/WhiG family RNA polymerase sigma factor [Eubacteriales bacterium]|nr:FliA/WhiG family RNA polymerase sigma factor [Eubacteriales bacterium]